MEGRVVACSCESDQCAERSQEGLNVIDKVMLLQEMPPPSVCSQPITGHATRTMHQARMYHPFHYY